MLGLRPERGPRREVGQRNRRRSWDSRAFECSGTLSAFGKWGDITQGTLRVPWAVWSGTPTAFAPRRNVAKGGRFFNDAFAAGYVACGVRAVADYSESAYTLRLRITVVFNTFGVRGAHLVLGPDFQAMLDSPFVGARYAFPRRPWERAEEIGKPRVSD